MDILAEAIRGAYWGTVLVTDEDIQHMYATIDMAEAVGHILVVPTTYDLTMKRLENQKKVLDVVVQLRKMMKEIYPTEGMRSLAELEALQSNS